MQVKLPAAVEYQPNRQLEHSDDPAAEYFPAPQNAHEVDEELPSLEDVPAGQLAQAELPAEDEYWPAGQFEHSDDPTSANRPAAQVAQSLDEVLATELEAVPAAQSVQMELLASSEYWPAGQLEHADDADRPIELE